MKKKWKLPKGKKPPWSDSSSEDNGRRHPDAAVPEDLPSKFYNENGEVDLRRVTGSDALKYFGALGIPLPVMRRADGR